MPNSLIRSLRTLFRIKRTEREMERELGADDIRRQLHNEAIMKALNESPQAINRAVQETVQSVNEYPASLDAPGTATADKKAG